MLLLIHTAARSGEVRAAMWSHVDLDLRTWSRPAELMKSRVAHVVTLTDAAVAILRRAEALRSTKADCLIFPGAGGKPLSDMTLTKVLRDAKLTWTSHGFRSSFRDWAAEMCPTIPDAVAEAALAHAVPDKVIAAYKRTQFVELRRKLLDAWAAYLQGQSNVLRLAGAA